MKISKTLKLAFNMLVHSRLRSWLTIIGIVIGVAAVVAIISIGNGLQANVQSRIGGLGQDLITISSGSSRAAGGFGGGENRASTTNPKPLSTKDIQALKLVAGIKYINPVISGRATVKYNTESTTSSIQGSDVGILKEFITATIESGRFMNQGESQSILIGNRLATGTFRNPLQVGNILVINDKPFRIVGILASVSGFGGSDSAIYMSEKDAREVLSTTLNLSHSDFSSIGVKVEDVNFVNDTSNKIEETLRNERHVTSNKQDFSVSSALALQQRFTQVTGAITLFLSLIAAVSLLVGGIGVANTMFTSVLEKTRDIGIMKAIGARNSDILLIFLFNSGMLGLTGGLIGIIIGSAISYILPLTGASLGFGGAGGGTIQTALSINLLLFALIFSMIIGMVSGALPAYNASKLKPVEALRYE